MPIYAKHEGLPTKIRILDPTMKMYDVNKVKPEFHRNVMCFRFRDGYHEYFIGYFDTDEKFKLAVANVEPQSPAEGWSYIPDDFYHKN